MKKILYFGACSVPIIYLIVYCLNVSDVVTRHDDTELLIPVGIMVISVLLGAALLIFAKSKKIDKKIFIIPLVFFVAATVTLIVGCCTVCEFCTL